MGITIGVLNAKIANENQMKGSIPFVYRLQLQISYKYGVLDVTAFSETTSELLEMNLNGMDTLQKEGLLFIKTVADAHIQSQRRLWMFCFRFSCKCSCWTAQVSYWAP